MALKIKNWGKFQHFKNRRPPWIKLYREILDQRDINTISDGAFRVLVGCWLIASEDGTQTGTLPDVETIAFRLRKPKSAIDKALQELDAFLIHDDIKVISKGYQLVPPETETETEGETEGEAPKSASPFDSPKMQEAWATWKRHRSEIRKPLKPTQEKMQIAKLKELGEARAIAAIDHSVEKGWVGLFEPKMEKAGKPELKKGKDLDEGW